MPDWDKESRELADNLTDLLRQIREEARKREEIDLATIRDWHKQALRGLTVPNPSMVGHFRGERGLENVEVKIGKHRGVSAKDVGSSVVDFERRLKKVIGRLDQLIAPEAELSEDQLAAVLDVCGWAHAEWVRIHPFANGNGRTARLLANSLAMRFGLPPFVRLRPRPETGYDLAGEAAMRGDWNSTASAFRKMLDESLKNQ